MSKVLFSNKIGLFVFAFLGLILQNCAKSALPKQSLQFDKNSENGLLIGAITFTKEEAKFSKYFFRLAATNTEEFEIKPSNFSKLKHNGELDNGKTYLFIIERPVGNYEIPSIRLFSNSGHVLLQGTNYVGGFSIPYQINKGEITYIGNIMVNEYPQHNEKVISLQNNLERDLSTLKELQPQISWELVNKNKRHSIIYNNKKAKL